jgi:hypothetical protein
LITCVSLVLGLVAGVVAAVTAGWSTDGLRGWPAFWLPFAAVAGGNLVVSARRRGRS